MKACRFLARLATLVSLSILGACLESSSGPVISEFRADPSEIAADSDAEVVLSWRIENGDDARLTLEAIAEGEAVPTRLADDLNGQERFIVRPQRTATYRLVVSGPGGSNSRAVTVRVEGAEPPPRAPAIESFRSSRSSVSPGEEVVLSWSVGGADDLVLTSDSGLAEDVLGRDGISVAVDRSTTFTLTATNAAGSASRSLVVQVADEPTEAILILIAGQSNAAGEGGPFPEGKETADDGVYMLTQGTGASQWRWVEAEEPTHSYPSPHQHSFGVRLGNELKRSTGRDVYLVPSAVGGTSISEWLPDHSSGYFSNAVARANHAADDLGVPVAAVAWFQGENDSKTSDMRNRFVEQTTEVFEAFHDRLTGTPPVIFAQLAKRLHDEDEPSRNLAYQVIREQQRLMADGALESGVLSSGSTPAGSTSDRSYFRMVVSHDLAMSDIRHLGRDGQKALGSRYAHEFLVSVWEGAGALPSGRAGPRLVGVTRESGSSIRVATSRAIEPSSGFEGYFEVFVDGSAVSLSGVTRDPARASDILISVQGSLPEDPNRIRVRYMPPDDTPLLQGTPEVVHAVDESGLRLPLPAFGLPVETFQSNFLNAF